MKKLYLLMPLVLFIVSCVKDNITPPPAAVKPVSVDNFNQSTYNSVFSLIKENRNPSGVNKRRTEVINLEVNEAMLYLEAALGAYLTDPELIPTNSTISTGFAAISYTTDQNGVKKLDQNAIDSLATALYNNCVSLGTQALAGQSGVKFLSMLDLNWTIDTTIGIVQVRPSYVFSTYTAYNYANMQTNIGYSPYYNHGCGVANLNAPGGALQIINDFLNSNNNPNYKKISSALQASIPFGQVIRYRRVFVEPIAPPPAPVSNSPNRYMQYYNGTIPPLWIGWNNECWELPSINYYGNKVSDYVYNDFLALTLNNPNFELTSIYLYSIPINNQIFTNANSNNPLYDPNKSLLNDNFPSTVNATWGLFFTLGIPFVTDSGAPIRF